VTPNETAIRGVLADDTLVLVEAQPYTLRALPNEIITARPSFLHDKVVALLDGIAESEWENWLLDCFKGEHGKRHRVHGLVVQRGGVYAE
jgi:hypothetical protein